MSAEYGFIEWGSTTWGGGGEGSGASPDIIGDAADAGIASEEAFGVGDVFEPDQIGNIGDTGIASAEAFGVGVLAEDAEIGDVGDSGIASAEAFDTGTITESIGSAVDSGIVSAEAFGTPGYVNTFIGDTGDAGIASAEAFGAVGFLSDLIGSAADSGIATAEAFGVGSLITNIIGGFSIVSEESFGVGGTLLSTGDLPDDLPANSGVFVLFHNGQVVGVCSNGEALYGVRVNTIMISRQLNFNATASYELYDEDGSMLPVQGQDVQIYCYDRLLSEWSRIFAGQIETATIEPRPGVIGSVRECVHKISCISYGQALTRRIVQAKFPASSFGTVNSVLGYLQSTILVQEGITWVPGADPGVALGDLDFTNGTPVNDLLDTMSEASNSSWQVDWSKLLYLSSTPTGSTVSSRAINETDKHFRNLQIIRSRGLYRNRQIVLGATTRTSKRMSVTYVIPFGLQGPPNGEAWAYFGTTWNSSTQSFDAMPALYLYDHRWDNRVEKIISIKVNGVEQIFYTVPTSGIPIISEIPSGWVWWTFAPSMNMVRNMGLPSGSEPQPGDTVVIEFDLVGEVPQPIIVENTAEIAYRKSIEGGSGIYEDIQRLPEIEDTETLREYAQSLLDKFSVTGIEVNIETDYLGFEPGMTQPIDLPSWDLPATSGIIESINMRDVSGRFPRIQVKVANRIQQRDALTAMQRLIRRLKTPDRGTKTQITFVLAQDIPGLSNPGLIAGTNVTNTYLVQQDFTLVECAIFFQQEPVGDVITIDINADGVSIFTEPLEYDTGTRSFTTFVNAPNTLPKGTKLTIDVLTTGTATPGKNGTVTLIGWV